MPNVATTRRKPPCAAAWQHLSAHKFRDQTPKTKRPVSLES